MFGKLNHLAITSDHYTLLGMFYRAMFGLKASGDTAREIGAISVGDGYVGMTLIPRRGGRKAGLDHFGIEVEDLDKVRSKVAKKYPDIEIVKRPGNRPFASYSAHDPAGNYFDLSQPGHENRAEVYAKGEWKQDTTFSHFAIRAREAERLADFYTDLFELEARNLPSEEGGYHLTDGRMTMAIVPWKISSFNGAGIEQPGPEHGHRTLTIIGKGGKDDDDRLGPTPANLRSCDTPARRYPAKTADRTGTAQQWLICARSRVKREQISAKPIRQGRMFS